MKLHRRTLITQIVGLWLAEDNWPETEMAQSLKSMDLSDPVLVKFIEELSPQSREYTALKLIITNLISLNPETRKEVIEDAKITERRQRQQKTKFGL